MAEHPNVVTDRKINAMLHEHGIDPATRDLRAYVVIASGMLMIVLVALAMLGIKEHRKTKAIDYLHECSKCTEGRSNGCYVWSDNTVQCGREP